MILKDLWAVEVFLLGNWQLFAEFERSDYAWITAQHIQSLIDIRDDQERPPGYIYVGSEVRVKRFNINEVIETKPPWEPSV